MAKVISIEERREKKRLHQRIFNEMKRRHKEKLMKELMKIRATLRKKTYINTHGYRKV